MSEDQIQKFKDKIKESANNTNSSISSIENLGQKVNELEKDPQGANKILLVTKDDNLVHDYFHYFECWWDANDCLSGVLLKMPKTEEENTKYWINYVGDIIVYMGNSINTDVVTNQGDTDGTYWDLQGLHPFFVGTTSRIKERQNELEIYIDSIGRKKKKKIPDEFRQAFINNQNVRDAFQAICEFLGVYYICPPPTTDLEDEEEEEQSTNKDGEENNANDKNKKEEKLASLAKKKVKSKKTTSKKSKSKSKKNKTIDIQNGLNNNNEENQEDEDVEGLDEEDTGDIQMNGYADINFDANGSIVHGQAVIETSPDMAQTLLALTEFPLHGNYEEEGNEYIAEDVEKFLNGEIFEQIHNNVMDYGAITIEPKSAESNSDMSATGGGNTNGSGTSVDDFRKKMGEQTRNTEVGLKVPIVYNAPSPIITSTPNYGIGTDYRSGYRNYKV